MIGRLAGAHFSYFHLEARFEIPAFIRHGVNTAYIWSGRHVHTFLIHSSTNLDFIPLRRTGIHETAYDVGKREERVYTIFPFWRHTFAPLWGCSPEYHSEAFNVYMGGLRREGLGLYIG